MKIFSSVPGALILAALLLAGPSRPARAPDPPDGFAPLLTGQGVTLFKKEYQNGTPDYVQSANLKQGAAIRLMTGSASDPGIGQGSYGGDNPSFSREPLSWYWEQISSASPNAFCVSNGSFFSTDPDPTPLAFPLKVNGRLLSEGYGGGEFPGQQRMLELWSDHAQISSLTPEALRASSAPDIIAGLAEDADKNASGLVGRTFVGITDGDNDGTTETVLIFSTRTSNQADAAGVLRAFQATALMMLDGGDSTQLMCKDFSYIHSSRAIPQALAVLAKAPPPLSAEISRQTNFPVLVEGEPADIELEVRNNGTVIWRAGQDRLVNQKNPYGAGSEYQLQQDIPPEESALFAWRTEPFTKWGVYTTEWQMMHGDQAFESETVKVNIVVLPRQLEDQRKELEGKVREWVDQKKEDVRQVVLAWMQERLNRLLENTSRKICGGIVWPVLSALLLLALRRARHGA